MLALGAMGFREEFNDNNGGGAALAEKDFQDQVLGGLGETKKTTDELVKNFDNLDSKTKGIFEDITKQKNEFEGLTGQVTAIEHSFKKLAINSRMSSGSPMVIR